MHFVVSPAKTLNYETPVPEHAAAVATRPQFLDRSAELIELLRPKTAEHIAELMDLSPALAQLNVERYQAWSTRFTARNSRPAVLAFDGDVYDGLQAWTLQPDDLAWAQQHVSILSGLYGLLRPLDRLQPYRLEMGTPLAHAKGRNLYDFWGDTLARHLNRRLAGEAEPVLVNLASQEYFRAADHKVLKPRVIECVFEDWKNGEYKVISFFAKRARGLMLRHAIDQRVSEPRGLESFRADGYALAEPVSEADRLVFRRRAQD